MKKRAFERIPLNIQVRFFSGTKEYSGIATNLSEKGMFISTEVSFPLKQQVEILISLKEEILKIPANIISFEKSGDIYIGIGVELFNPPPTKYLEFVNSFKAKEFKIVLTISNETLEQTTECQRNFQCLTENRNMCLIDRPVNGRGLFIKERVSSIENCPYIESSEYAFICNCPTRHEIYMRYNI
jgi:hypothetical protein